MANTDFNPDRMELIRRYPRWFASLANRVLRWTTNYCAGGCGYPVTGRFYEKIESLEGVTVRLLICSIHGRCHQKAVSDPRDENGRPYDELREDIVADLPQLQRDGVEFVDLSFGPPRPLRGWLLRHG